MNVTAILLSAGVMVVLGVLFGVILTIADKKFKVEVDPRVEAVRACLGGANCGACGYAGCDAFADAVVAGKAPVNFFALLASRMIASLVFLKEAVSQRFAGHT